MMQMYSTETTKTKTIAIKKESYSKGAILVCVLYNSPAPFFFNNQV